MIQPPPTSTLFPYTTLFRSYYVKSLMGGARLSDNEERLISHQFHQVELNVGEWVRLAASVLSSRVQNPVVISPPIAATSRIRHVDLVKIGTSSVLVVVVLEPGAVRQQVLRTMEELSSEDLSQEAA